MAKKKRRPKQTFSGEIREAIESCGLSRYAISKASGVDQASLTRFMAGKHGLALETLDAIAPVIGLHAVLEPRDEKKGN